MTEKNIFDQANETIEKYSEKNFLKLFDELRAVMAGTKKVNKDRKRVLCAEVNAWITFLGGENAQKYPTYYVDENGDIKAQHPDPS